jgi:hypothetical protein
LSVSPPRALLACCMLSFFLCRWRGLSLLGYSL